MVYNDKKLLPQKVMAFNERKHFASNVKEVLLSTDQIINFKILETHLNTLFIVMGVEIYAESTCSGG